MAPRSQTRRPRDLGSAKEGLHHWWMQRVTALALIPLALWFVASIAGLSGASHAAVRDWLASPVVAVLMVLLSVATFYHAQLGLQVIYEDYIHNRAVRMAADLATKFAAAVLAVASVFAVLKIAFGA